MSDPSAEPLGAMDQIALVGRYADPVLVDTDHLGRVCICGDEEQPGHAGTSQIGPQRLVARPLHQLHVDAGKIGRE